MMLLLCKIIFTIFLCSFVSCKSPNGSNKKNVIPEVPTPYAIYNECGGYIEAKLDETVVIEYKPNQEYDNDEFCVWEIKNYDCMHTLFTKTISGFEVGYDYLQISSTDVSYYPQSTNHLLGNTTEMEQATSRGDIVHFVIFTTDNDITGTGFRLEIVGYGERTAHVVYDDFLSYSPIGSTTLRPYLNNMFQTFLIVPKFKTVSSLVLDIKYLTEFRMDYFSVFTMERNGRTINFKMHAAQWSGIGSTSFEAEYYTNFIVMFDSTSAGIPNGGGLDLNWHPSDNATNENRA